MTFGQKVQKKFFSWWHQNTRIWSKLSVWHVINFNTTKYAFNGFLTALQDHLQLKVSASISTTSNRTINIHLDDTRYHKHFKDPKYFMNQSSTTPSDIPDFDPIHDYAIQNFPLSISVVASIASPFERDKISRKCNPGSIRDFLLDLRST